MRHILAQAQRELLAQFAWSNVLLAFDFDGTLAPIVPSPDAAAMRVGTHRRLVATADRYPTVVISGRGRDDVAARLEGVALRAIVGNHGVEPSAAMTHVAGKVRHWIDVLYERVSILPGVEVEDKRYSVAVHYRQSRTRGSTRAAIERVVADLGNEARMIGGKCVVNVVHQDAPHKGFALQRLRERFGCDRAIYVGDDTTDEDVFALDDPSILDIRIGRTEKSRAAFYLQRQAEIDELLSRLVTLRHDTHGAQRAEYL